MQNNVLGLYIPNQRLAETDAPYAHPKEAEKWISELPTAHIGETSRLLYKALAEINRANIPSGQRFKLMELYRPMVAYVSEALDNYYLGQPFPLSAKNLKIAELSRELQWEMAIGYKIIIVANLSGFTQRVDAKILLASIHRAIVYLSETLLKAYQVYSPPPEHAWVELHHLYLFAEHNKLDTQPVKDKQHPAGATSILDAYKQILLLAIANPFRLPQKEISKVYDALYNWCPHSDLLPMEQHGTLTGLFMVDLEKDTAPTYIHEPDDEEPAKHKRILDTSSLTRILRDMVSDIELGPQYETESQTLTLRDNTKLLSDTLKRLILAWGAIPKRNFSRTSKNLDARVSLGLSATHYFIEKKQNKAVNISRQGLRTPAENVRYASRASFNSAPAHNAAEQQSNIDVWDVAENPSLESSPVSDFEVPSFFDTSFELAEEPEQREEKDLYDNYRCCLINESAGGFCLRWDNGVPTKAMVGSLIGVHYTDKDQSSKWGIGVVRWMKSTGENNEMVLGVELLAPKAEPVAAKNISHKARLAEYMRCLLLPEIRAINQPQTLVTPSLYRVGERLRLNLHGQNVKVRLTKLLESTNTFSQFQFNILKSVENVSPTDKLDRIKNFDSIWSSL